MKSSSLLVAAAVATIAAASAAEAKPGNGHGGGKGRPVHAVAAMTNTGVDTDARGKLDVKFFPAVGKRAERSWLRFKLGKLDAGADYTLWMDMPNDDPDAGIVQVTDVTLVPGERGGLNFRLDTKKGDVLPFGASLADLSGMAVEIRDATGVAVLSGNLPAVQ